MEKLESGNAVLQTIHSSEGGRALKLLNQRQKQQKELDDARIEIESETKKRRLHKIDEKYHGSTTGALTSFIIMSTINHSEFVCCVNSKLLIRICMLISTLIYSHYTVNKVGNSSVDITSYLCINYEIEDRRGQGDLLDGANCD